MTRYHNAAATSTTAPSYYVGEMGGDYGYGVYSYNGSATLTRSMFPPPAMSASAPTIRPITRGGGTNTVLDIGNASNTGSVVQLDDLSGGHGGIQEINGGLWVGTVSSAPVYFVTNGNPAMSISTTGYVGIGTTSPAGQLQVVSTSTGAGYGVYSSMTGAANTGFAGIFQQFHIRLGRLFHRRCVELLLRQCRHRNPSPAVG